MSTSERNTALAALRDSLEAHDAAALAAMRDAQKHLKRARDLSAQLEALERRSRGRSLRMEHAA
jgi:hypothetical protein